MDNPGHAGRVSKYTAQSLLRKAGYEAEKITGTCRIFDIIAWKRENILGLVVRSSRSKGIAGYSSLVVELGEIVQKRLFPGDIQIWILQAHEWKRYQILPGGAMLYSGNLS